MSTVTVFQVENGAEVELPKGYEYLAVASSDSFRTWLLLRKQVKPCAGNASCGCQDLRSKSRE